MDSVQSELNTIATHSQYVATISRASARNANMNSVIFFFIEPSHAVAAALSSCNNYSIFLVTNGINYFQTVASYPFRSNQLERIFKFTRTRQYNSLSGL